MNEDVFRSIRIEKYGIEPVPGTSVEAFRNKTGRNITDLMTYPK